MAMLVYQVVHPGKLRWNPSTQLGQENQCLGVRLSSPNNTLPEEIPNVPGMCLPKNFIRHQKSFDINLPNLQQCFC